MRPRQSRARVRGKSRHYGIESASSVIQRIPPAFASEWRADSERGGAFAPPRLSRPRRRRDWQARRSVQPELNAKRDQINAIDRLAIALVAALADTALDANLVAYGQFGGAVTVLAEQGDAVPACVSSSHSSLTFRR